ncbi:MAG: hypothetical protein IIY02_04200, partial [Firmicutes bacterium]|nr:hypothetical protein [Bacillota bacterium]
MTPNKLTPEEKQMPAVHLPAKIPLMCVFNLFVTAFANYILWTKDGIAAMIALLVIFVLPAMIGIFAYANCVVRFDKDTVVYRNFFRKIRRYPMNEIRAFEKGSLFASAITDDISIPVNTRSQNGKWLAQLIELKLHPETEEQEKLTEAEYHKWLIYILPVMMLGLFLFMYFAIEAPQDIIEYIICYGFFGLMPVALTIYALNYRNRRIFFSDTEFLYIDGKKREHHHYWKDLTKFRTETIWHTDWYGTSRANHWIQFELSEDYVVDGLRYLPREGSSNGI